MSHQIAIDYYNKGLEYSYQEDWDEAIEYLKMAIQEDPTYVNAYNVLGKVYIQKEEIDAAKKIWRRALKFDPDNFTAKQCLNVAGGFFKYTQLNWLLPAILVIFIAGLAIINITMLRRIDKLETALISANAKATIQKSPDEENPTNNIPEPIQIASPVNISIPKIETEHQLTEVYNNALKDCLSGNTTQVIEVFREILKYPKPHSLKGNAQYWLAECYYDQKDYHRAFSEFEKVKVLFPKSNKVFDAELKIAYTYYRLGRIQDAKDKIAQLNKDWSSQQYRSKIAVLSKEIFK